MSVLWVVGRADGVVQAEGEERAEGVGQADGVVRPWSSKMPVELTRAGRVNGFDQVCTFVRLAQVIKIGHLIILVVVVTFFVFVLILVNVNTIVEHFFTSQV